MSSDASEASEEEVAVDADSEGVAGGGDREDWALEREHEIARLAKENEELRRMLGIDTDNARRHGILDEDLLDPKPVLIHSRHSHLSSHGSLGLPDSWGARSPPQQQQQFMAEGPVGGIGGGAQPGNTPSAMVTLQRSSDFQPGVRTAGALRRPSMFGQRGRGGGMAGWAPSQDRPWRDLLSNFENAGPSSSLDLAS